MNVLLRHYNWPGKISDAREAMRNLSDVRLRDSLSDEMFWRIRDQCVDAFPPALSVGDLVIEEQ